MDQGVLSQYLEGPPSKKKRGSENKSGLHLYSCPGYTRGEVLSRLGSWRPFTQGPTSSSIVKAAAGT